MRYENTEIQAKCPICGSTSGHVLHRMLVAEAAQHYVLKEVQPKRHSDLVGAIRNLWGQDSAAWVRCSHCGFTHAQPHVGGDAAFYTLAYERTHYPADKWEFRRSIQAIRDHIASTGQALQDLRVLEIGAGEGRFVAQLIQMGIPPENITCTEYSDFGRKQISGMGVNCHAKDVAELTREDLPDPVQIVCMFQVLEHLDNLDQRFARLMEVCSDQAMFLFAVPAARRMEFNELNGSLLDMPPNHVGRWTKQAFSVLCDTQGWRLDHHEIEPDPIVNRLRQYVKYRYLRRMQDSGSLANRVERLAPSALRTLLRAGLALGYTALRPLSVLRLITGRDLGNSQWVQMSRAP